MTRTLQAGKLDRRIELQTQAAGSDGDPFSGAWTTQKTVYAEKTEKGGVERFAAEQELAESSAVFRIRFDSAVTPLWRIKDDLNDFYDIVAAVEGEGTRRETLLFAKRLDPNDV